MKDRSKVAPGPRGLPVLGHALEFRRDVLSLLLNGRKEFGDITRYTVGPYLVHLFAHPDQIKHVLVEKAALYDKGTRSSSKIQSITGPGLLTSSGELWHRERRLMQPAFGYQSLARFVELMTETIAAKLENWQARPDSDQPMDMASEMTQLTYTIVGKILFGADVSEEINDVETAATIVMEHVWHRVQAVLDIPASIPTPRNRRFRNALRMLDQVVYRIMAQRQNDKNPPADLLSILLHRSDDETGGRMSEAQLRNETVTLLLAGHETTANALAWFWHVLTTHPEVERRVREEVNRVLNGRRPSFEDLEALTYTTQTLQETLRLYPPIWIMERRALAEDTVMGFRIPQGSSVVLCPYVTHRHPELWNDPETFDPERFTAEQLAKLPQYAFIPFGGGQRLCLGSHFAMMEARLIIAMVMPSFRLSAVPGWVVTPHPGITLRLRQGLPLYVRSRE